MVIASEIWNSVRHGLSRIGWRGGWPPNSFLPVTARYGDKPDRRAALIGLTTGRPSPLKSDTAVGYLRILARNLIRPTKAEKSEQKLRRSQGRFGPW
jgi:hypothetical protein